VQRLELRGIEGLRSSIRAAQEARRRHAVEGVWEAADLAWWWRQPRTTDTAITRVWTDAGVPVRAVRPIAWKHGVSVEVLGLDDAVPVTDVAEAIEQTVAETGASTVSVAASSEGRWHDEHLVDELRARGWSPGHPVGGGGWTSTAPRVTDAPEEVTVVAMTGREGAAHHMAARVGGDVQDRLTQTGLYDHRFDLVAIAGRHVVGSALGWFDALTATGSIEPVAVDEAHRRRGLATRLVTQLTEGLMDAGARRIRINWEHGGAAEGLYRRLGFADDVRMWMLERE
jgi:ribosomal protein S18 acetylase RimI-like enzyme